MTARIRVAIVASLLGATSLLGFAGGAHAAVPAAFGKACYPNQYVIDPGPTQATSFGTIRDNAGSIEHASGDTSLGARLLWAAHLQVVGPNSGSPGDQSPGNIVGHLAATILWDDGTTTLFFSRCAAETSTGADGGMEMETEGWVTNFPGIPGTVPAIGTFTAQPSDTSGLSVAFSIDFGTTCFPDSGAHALDELKVSNEASPTGFLVSPHEAHGRWAFPDGSTPNNCDSTGD
jgi:hypothetical protein